MKKEGSVTPLAKGNNRELFPLLAYKGVAAPRLFRLLRGARTRISCFPLFSPFCLVVVVRFVFFRRRLLLLALLGVLAALAAAPVAVVVAAAPRGPGRRSQPPLEDGHARLLLVVDVLLLSVSLWSLAVVDSGAGTAQMAISFDIRNLSLSSTQA